MPARGVFVSALAHCSVYSERFGWLESYLWSCIFCVDTNSHKHTWLHNLLYIMRGESLGGQKKWIFLDDRIRFLKKTLHWKLRLFELDEKSGNVTTLFLFLPFKSYFGDISAWTWVDHQTGLKCQREDTSVYWQW